MAAQNFPNQTVGLVRRGQRPVSGPFQAVPRATGDIVRACVAAVEFDFDTSGFAQPAMRAAKGIARCAEQLNGARNDFAKSEPSPAVKAGIKKAADRATSTFGYYPGDRAAAVDATESETLGGIQAAAEANITADRGPVIAKLAGGVLSDVEDAKTGLADLQAMKMRPLIQSCTPEERAESRDMRDEIGTWDDDRIYSYVENALTRRQRAIASGDSARLTLVANELKIFHVAVGPLLHARNYKQPGQWHPGIGSKNDLGARGGVKAREILAALEKLRQVDAAPSIEACSEILAQLERLASLIFGVDVSYTGRGGVSPAQFQKLLHSSPMQFDYTAFDPGSIRRALYRETEIGPLQPWTSSVLARLNRGAK